MPEENRRLPERTNRPSPRPRPPQNTPPAHTIDIPLSPPPQRRSIAPNNHPHPQNTAPSRPRREQELQRRIRLRRRKRRIFRFKLMVSFILMLLIIGGGLSLFRLLFPQSAKNSAAVQASSLNLLSAAFEEKVPGPGSAAYDRHPLWEEDFLPISEYARPGTLLRQVKNIFVHYTANPGTSAAQNHNYFKQLMDTHETSASAHFIIGYDGEIIQCIPLDEMAYAVQTRNEDSISIECCYTAADGSFTPVTYASLIELLKWLTDVYGLDENDILRHYDCGGKKCPLYYTENEDAWQQLKLDVREA